MREIKFRAWDKKNSEWMDFSHLALDPDTGYLLTSELPGEFGHFDGTAYEIMQYTGLKDRNGVEIYEGDVVSHGMPGYSRNDEVYWGRDGWYVKKSDPGYLGDFTCEVIGNIYENPELLEDNK